MGLVWLNAGHAPVAHSITNRSADTPARSVMELATERTDKNVRPRLAETVVARSELRASRRTTRSILISSRVGGSGRSPDSGCCQFVPEQTRAGTLRYNPFTGDSFACVIVNAGEHDRNRGI